jgi:hypothetical protein
MTVTAQPQWIARMFPGKVGRDHLGLGSVSSDQILPSLSPGINVLTLHPRYFSFYVFLLDEFWQREYPRSDAAFSEFYRPRECIFSIGAHLCDQPEHDLVRTIIGSQKTYGLAAQRRAAYDPGFNYIKSPLGGYGLYYRSVMAELEVIYPGGPGLPYPLDVPSERGRMLAATFREAIQHTTYYREYFSHPAQPVPLAGIIEYLRAACLCQLQCPSAPDRPLLLDIFLHGGDKDAAAVRRATLRMCLEIAEQTNGVIINQEQFRQLLFFRAALGGATYQPCEAVLATFLRWRLYQAREYYAFALNALWYYLCDWGIRQNGDLRPVPIEQFWQHLETLLRFDSIAELLALSLPDPPLGPNSGLTRLLAWLCDLIAASEGDFDDRCTLQSPIHEHILYALAINAHDGSADIRLLVPAMVIMLALGYLRFGSPGRWLQPEWGISRMGADGRLSLDGFVKALRRRLEQRALNLFEFARWIYEEYVILQHQIVATGKLPDNTFRFQREGNQLRFYKLFNSLTFNDSRFDALSTTAHELGLCGDLLLDEHGLTEHGARLLADGDL